MEFRILGPLEVVDGDRSVPLGGGRQRALLALLLTRPNEVVSTDRLADELWAHTHRSYERRSAPIGIGGLFRPTGEANATETQARRVALEFFRSQNERRYDDTCRLLSRGFYRTHRLRDRQTCVALLRVSFMWSGQIRFRTGKVAHEGGRLVVPAVADGAPGQIVLVREGRNVRILAVGGSQGV